MDHGSYLAYWPIWSISVNHILSEHTCSLHPVNNCFHSAMAELGS